MIRLRRRAGRTTDPLDRARRTAEVVTRSDPWLWPWWLERQLRPSNAAYVAIGGAGVVENVTGRDWSTVGTLAGPSALVDPAGLVVVDEGWSLDWWVGADDRWHLPARDTVRQHRLDGGPVVETLLRIPGGDAIHRAYVVPDADGAPVTVVEIENASSVPVAIALAVRPADLDGVGRIGRIAVGDDGIDVDGVRALSWSRPPGRLASGSAASGDALVPVLDGRASERRGPAEVSCDAGLATAALIWPLPHTAILRFVAGNGSLAADPPAVGEVLDGWSALRGRGVVLDVPDAGVGSALAASIDTLALYASPGSGIDVLARSDRLTVVRGLLAGGLAALAAQTFADEIGEVDTVAEADADGVVGAAADLWRLAREVDPVVSRVGPVTVAAHRASDAVAAADLVALAEALGGDQPDVAADLGRFAAERPAADPVAPSPEEAWSAVVEMAAASRLAGAWPTECHPRLGTGSAGRGHDPLRAVAFVRDAVDALVRVDAADGVVEMLPHVPTSWFGQPIEIHRVPTSLGSVSLAVRWHGARPAVLWEVEPHDGVGAVELRIPGLDPTWSTDAPSGEALLAAPEVPAASGESFS